MKLEQFEVLEAICKKAWGELAVSGDKEKPDYLNRFFCYCPTCEVAHRAVLLTDTINRCYFCPIDEWRKEAIGGLFAPCDVGIYGEWLDGDENTRKEAAAQIAAMKWSYLPEYEGIDVSDLLEG